MVDYMKIGIPMSKSKTQCYINQAYMDYIRDAGLSAIALTEHSDINDSINMLDGLILPGGIDIDPIYYGEDNFSSYGSDIEKDAFERTLFHAFRLTGKPVLGICRGLQLIIREYLIFKPKLEKFMTFLQEISGHNQVNDQNLDRNAFQHFVEFLPNLLYGVKMKAVNTMPVNSMHHQGLVTNFEKNGVIGVQGFKMAAWTTRGLTAKFRKIEKNKNTVICEAFRILDWGAPILAVQWHPEELKDIELIHNFFTEKSDVNYNINLMAKKQEAIESNNA